MSVVNRMLQDIDRRRTAAGIDTPSAYPDIRIVAARSNPGVPIGRALWIAALFIGVCATGAIVWRESQVRKLEITTLPPPTSVADKGGLPVVLPAVPVPVAAEPIEKLAAELPAPPLPPVRNTVQPSTDTLKLSVKLSALVADSQAKRLSVPAMPLTSKSVPTTTTVSTVPARQVAADETVQAARGMWNDGSRVGAVATLREALAVAETTHNDRATVALARELARLDVADNRAEDALNLLRRLESVFSEDADAWALRGNAEQRLAMHAEAAQSYLAALRIRPSEGKWMLGAAISLAAVGKLDEAKTWAERARERGAITPTISAYLQQLGITAHP